MFTELSRTRLNACAWKFRCSATEWCKRFGCGFRSRQNTENASPNQHVVFGPVGKIWPFQPRQATTRNNADAKRQDLEQQLEKASGLREGQMQSRKKRAAQHYEKVEIVAKFLLWIWLSIFGQFWKVSWIRLMLALNRGFFHVEDI